MKLRDYLYFNRISVTSFAKKIGYSRGHLCSVMYGKRIASEDFELAVHHASNGQVTEMCEKPYIEPELMQIDENTL